MKMEWQVQYLVHYQDDHEAWVQSWKLEQCASDVAQFAIDAHKNGRMWHLHRGFVWPVEWKVDIGESVVESIESIG